MTRALLYTVILTGISSWVWGQGSSHSELLAGLSPTTKVIPRFGVSGLQNVTFYGRSKDDITVMHDAGVLTGPLTHFADEELELLYPGFRARKLADEAARRKAEYEEKQRYEREIRSIEDKLQKEIAEAFKAWDADPETSSPLICILVCGQDTYEEGQCPAFGVRIVNRSAKEVQLVYPLEQSGIGRSPQCLFDARNSDGKPLPRLGSFCGNTSHLSSSAFVSVPGRTVFNPGFQRYSEGYPFHPVVTKPGVYKVRCLYSTRSENIRSYLGFQQFTVEPAIHERFSKLTHVALWSKEITITFRPKRK